MNTFSRQLQSLFLFLTALYLSFFLLGCASDTRKEESKNENYKLGEKRGEDNEREETRVIIEEEQKDLNETEIQTTNPSFIQGNNNMVLSKEGLVEILKMIEAAKEIEYKQKIDKGEKSKETTDEVKEVKNALMELNKRLDTQIDKNRQSKSGLFNFFNLGGIAIGFLLIALVFAFIWLLINKVTGGAVGTAVTTAGNVAEVPMRAVNTGLEVKEWSDERKGRARRAVESRILKLEGNIEILKEQLEDSQSPEEQNRLRAKINSITKQIRESEQERSELV